MGPRQAGHRPGNGPTYAVLFLFPLGCRSASASWLDMAVAGSSGEPREAADDSALLLLGEVESSAAAASWLGPNDDDGGTWEFMVTGVGGRGGVEDARSRGHPLGRPTERMGGRKKGLEDPS